VERDTYVLGPDDRLNLKVRARTRSVKVKELVERTDDGFELWRTAMDARLPASAQVWTDVASRLSVELDASPISTLDEPRAVVSTLCAAGDVRCVELGKERVFFPSSSGHVEVAEIAVSEGAFQTVAFESLDLAPARSLRAALGETDLGPPQNYVAFCSLIAASRGAVL
jgi:hypothetical protein